VTSSVNLPEKLPNRFNVTSSDVRAELDDWRTPIMDYLGNPSAKIDKSFQQLACNSIMTNIDLIDFLPNACL
jgi:hypothetical protein